jgi:hypothetical protein
LHLKVATHLALASVLVLCGITDKCGGLFGPSIGEKLDITSAPEGATVKVDGEEMGTTPLTLTELDVEEGQTQKLVFVLDGYLSHEEEITWTQAEQSVAVTLKEAAKERVITVKSIPAKAKVYIDGNKKGETPCSFSMEMVDGEEFAILVQRKGYSDVNEKVTVTGDTIITLSYNFKREGGKANKDLDEELVGREKKWRKACKTYASDVCSFEYTINQSGEVTDVDSVKCKYKDITGCTKRQVKKMEFPATGDVRSDAYTWKGSN